MYLDYMQNNGPENMIQVTQISRNLGDRYFINQTSKVKEKQGKTTKIKEKIGKNLEKDYKKMQAFSMFV